MIFISGFKYFHGNQIKYPYLYLTWLDRSRWSVWKVILVLVLNRKFGFFRHHICVHKLNGTMIPSMPSIQKKLHSKNPDSPNVSEF